MEVIVNVDGLPLSKSSSSTQVYPILCSLFKYAYVEIIGLYHGFAEQKEANAF